MTLAPTAPVAETESALGQTPPRRPHVRSPVDLLRLIIGGVLLVGGIGFANTVDTALLGLSDDGAAAIEDLPAWVRDLPGTSLAVAVMAAVAAALVTSLLTTRYRRFAALALGLGAAAAASVVVGDVIDNVVDDQVRQAFNGDGPILRYRGPDGRIHPGDPLLAGAIAMLAVSTSYLRRSTIRRLGLLLGVYAAVSVLSSGIPAVGLVADIGVGILVGSLVLLGFGRHDLTPDSSEVIDGLASVGLHVTVVEPPDAAPFGFAPTLAVTSAGEQVLVRAVGRDEPGGELLSRAYRWLRLRKTGDHRPFVNVQRAVEHEALVALQAATLAIPTPKIVAVANAGIDGMVLGYQPMDGIAADNLGDIDDEVLVAIWAAVAQLHRNRIAHRDLRLANIVVDPDNRPWLTDFRHAELAASDQLLGTDVAELLASTAAALGPERAVAAAATGIELDELERAMPWLQPLALTAVTRDAVGGAKGLASLRTLLIEQCGVAAEEPVKLQRVDAKLLFVLATIVLSAWFLIPQLADIDTIWEQARHASASWAAAAVAFSVVTYIAATASLLGAIPYRLRFGPALLAQIASSFANRVTPAKVGGVAINIRYFQRRGVPAAVGVTAVGLNAVAGVVVHVVLTVSFLLLASSNNTAAGLTLPSPATLGIVAAGLVAVVAVSIFVPVTRRLLSTHVLPQLRAGIRSIVTISHNPGRLALLLGGSAVITLAYLGAMVSSLEAFGSTASLPIMALLFLTGSAVANAAPTPGGLGGAEAALIAALSTIEEVNIVVPAVFLYRFVTFWLPILPGWAALTYLRQTDRL